MYRVKDEQREIDEFYKNAYRACFRIQLGDQNKQWAPHFINKYCEENLVSELMELKNSLVFEFQWFRTNNKMIMTTFTSVWWKV